MSDATERAVYSYTVKYVVAGGEDEVTLEATSAKHAEAEVRDVLGVEAWRITSIKQGEYLYQN